MSWREVTAADLDWLTPFLREHVQSSMFLLSNLAQAGLNGAGPYGTRLWCQTGADPGVLGLTNNGYLMLQAPAATEADWQATAPFWCDAVLSGCSGDAAQVRQFLPATGLDQRPMSLNPEEPGYVLNLNNMKMPDSAGFALAPLTESTRAQAIAWRASFHGEVLGTPKSQQLLAATVDIDRYLEHDSHRILLRDGELVGMTGFNARLPDTVQIGAVFTPPALRGQGMARRAVALHLKEAQAKGVTTAILFAANAAAARAYEAIGFQRKGSMSMAQFFKDGQIQ